MTALIDEPTLLQLLDTRLVNFSDIEEVTGFALLVCQAASYGGLFLGDAHHTPLLTQVRKAAKEWVRTVRSNLPAMPLADALSAINIFDPVHRIAYGSPADSSFINRYTLAAFDAYTRNTVPHPATASFTRPSSHILGTLSSEKFSSPYGTNRHLPDPGPAIDPYTLFQQIKLGLIRKDRAYFFRPLQWYSSTLDRWYSDFSAPSPSSTSSSFSTLSVYDTIQRVTLLLQSDLRSYLPTNQDAFKQRLFDTHRPLLDTLPSSDLPTLKALYGFLTSSSSYLTEDDLGTYLRTLSEAIRAHKSVNRFFCIAFSLQQLQWLE